MRLDAVFTGRVPPGARSLEISGLAYDNRSVDARSVLLRPRLHA